MWLAQLLDYTDPEDSKNDIIAGSEDLHALKMACHEDIGRALSWDWFKDSGLWESEYLDNHSQSWYSIHKIRTV